MRARLHFSVLFLLFSLAFLSVFASGQNTEADISARLVDKPLLLRGFWAGDHLKFSRDGTPVKRYPLLSFTEAGIDVRSVRQKNGVLRIDGQRMGLTFSENGAIKRVAIKGQNYDGHIVLEIADIGAGQDASAALNAIFVPDLDSLVPQLPFYWQRYARTHFLARSAGGQIQGMGSPDSPDPSRAAASSSRSDNPGVTTTSAESGRPQQVGGSIKPPRTVRTGEPEFSEAARVMKLSGNVEIYLWVMEDGSPSHIEITRPVGLGLDEQAVVAASRYHFQPATQNGKPVKVEIYMDVNFQIF